jgi:hypothetical protein
VCLPFLAGFGCNKRPYACDKVSGKVTYEDGSLIPAERIRMVFVPQRPPIDPKTAPRNGTADADVKTGAFNCATTFAHADGIIAGEHKVVIQCIRNGILARDLVADEFTDPAKTPLVVRSGDSPFDFRVRRPQESARADH